MGYDFSVKFGSVEETQKMIEFLEENRSVLNELIATEKGDFFNMDFYTGESISPYAPKQDRDKMISFHGTLIPKCVWKLGYWLATKSSFRNQEGNPVVYSDDEEIPLFFNGVESQNINVDENGFQIQRKKEGIKEMIIHKLLNVNVKEQDNIIKKLNENWILKHSNESKVEKRFKL